MYEYCNNNYICKYLAVVWPKTVRANWGSGLPRDQYWHERIMRKP